jgi:hypothetical protein
MGVMVFFGLSAGQEATPNRKFHVVEYPSNHGIIVNPSLIAEEDGQTAAVSLFWPMGFDGDIYPYLSLNTHVIQGIYVGISYLNIGSDLEGDVAPYSHNYYSFCAAYKYKPDLSFSPYVSAGINLNVSRQDLFNLVEEDYFSFDAGMNIQFLDLNGYKVKSGLAFQNFTSNKIRGTDERKFDKYVDWFYYVSALEGMLYFSGTVNVSGEDITYESGLIPRWGGFMKTAVYGVRPIEYCDLSIKYKGDDALWLGLGIIAPFSKIDPIYKDLTLQFDLSPDKLDNQNRGRGTAYNIYLKGGVVAF